MCLRKELSQLCACTEFAAATCTETFHYLENFPHIIKDLNLHYDLLLNLLETTCVKRPPALRDHCYDTATLLKST